MTEGRELTNQENIITLKENENYKYLGMLEADTIKQTKMKEKLSKYISGQRKNYLKPNYITETSSNR